VGSSRRGIAVLTYTFGQGVYSGIGHCSHNAIYVTRPETMPNNATTRTYDLKHDSLNKITWKRKGMKRNHDNKLFCDANGRYCTPVNLPLSNLWFLAGASGKATWYTLYTT